MQAQGDERSGEGARAQPAGASSFGVLLRRYRAALGLTQAELAERAGLSTRGIADLERGARRSPHPETVKRLAQALRLDERDRERLAGARRGKDAAPVPEQTAGSSLVPTLPSPLTSFVGRTAEVAEVRRQLTEVRLLTLTGVGGIGKTRLALRAAHGLAEEEHTAVAFVDLALLTDAAAVTEAVAHALGVREQPPQPLLTSIADSLRRQDLLLILDNCEHLVDACSALVGSLLPACPSLRVLATSRESLGIPGETTWRVPALAISDEASPPGTGQAEAVALFVDRARAVLPGFALTDRNGEAVENICRQLDGLPLAIELAAARVNVLSPEDISARLGDRFRLLSLGPRSAPPRQHTLRAALDWSYDLLTEPERELFCALSVFAGGWTLASAEAVCPGGDVRAEDVVDLLTRLVDKSLVLVEQGEDDSRRYRLLETVRQYARERLAERGETVRLQTHHAGYFADLVARAEPELWLEGQIAWLEQLEREHDNLRAALRWQIDSGEAEAALRLAAALGRFWWVRGHLVQGRRWLGEALQAGQAASPAARAKALSGLGNLVRHSGDADEAVRLQEQSLALWRATGDRLGLGYALQNLGMAVRAQGQLARAQALLEEGLAVFRDLGDSVGMALALNNLGVVARDQNPERSARLHEESLALRTKLGDTLGIAHSLNDLGIVVQDQGDYRRAAGLHAEALRLFEQLANTQEIAVSVERLAWAAAAVGEPGRAVVLFGAAATLRERIGCPVPPPYRADNERWIAVARRALSDPELEAHWQAGQRLSTSETVAYARTTAGVAAGRASGANTGD